MTVVKAYFRKGHVCGITKKRQENPMKGHNCDFPPALSISRELGMIQLPKRYVVLKVFRENKVLLKKGTVFGTACRK